VLLGRFGEDGVIKAASKEEGIPDGTLLA